MSSKPALHASNQHQMFFEIADRLREDLCAFARAPSPQKAEQLAIALGGAQRAVLAAGEGTLAEQACGGGG